MVCLYWAAVEELPVSASQAEVQAEEGSKGRICYILVLFGTHWSGRI